MEARSVEEALKDLRDLTFYHCSACEENQSEIARALPVIEGEVLRLRAENEALSRDIKYERENIESVLALVDDRARVYQVEVLGTLGNKIIALGEILQSRAEKAESALAEAERVILDLRVRMTNMEDARDRATRLEGELAAKVDDIVNLAAALRSERARRIEAQQDRNAFEVRIQSCYKVISDLEQKLKEAGK